MDKQPAGGPSNSNGAENKETMTAKDHNADLYKDVWGHLPETLRAEMNAYSNTKGFMPEYEDAHQQATTAPSPNRAAARETERMWTRRQFVSRSAGGCWGRAASPLRFAGRQPRARTARGVPDGSASKDMITPRTDQAIDRGLAFLNAARRGRVPGSFGTGGYTGNVAVTSLAALAFMAAGNQPNRGPYGRIVIEPCAMSWLRKTEAGGHPGFLHNPMDSSHGPMYGHGFGTLFLAEVSGMVHDRALREELDAKLHRGRQLILISQNSEGGWRYDPERAAPHDADISVTICQIMALRGPQRRHCRAQVEGR